MIARSINRIASVLRSIDHTIIIQNVGSSEFQAASRDANEEVVLDSSTEDMFKNLTEVQARAFDSPPIISSGGTGSEIDSSDDIRSSADRLRKLR